MAGYYIGEITITDLGAYEDYKPMAHSAIRSFGGDYIVRGGKTESLEGKAPRGRIVMIKFPSVEVCKTWFGSEEYAPAHAIRNRAAVSRTFVVEGPDIEPVHGMGAAGYYIGERDVHDEEGYAKYARFAGLTIEEHKGEYLVKGGAWERLEGAAPMPRVIVVRFPSVTACMDWYNSDDYDHVHPMRDKAAKSRTFVVEGV